MKTIAISLMLLLSFSASAEQFWNIGDTYPKPLLSCIDPGLIIDLFETDLSEMETAKAALIENKKCTYIKGYEFANVQRWNVLDGYQGYLVTIQFLSLPLYSLIAGEKVNET